MSSSLNSVTISGNLGQDPQVKILPSSTAVCEFSIAVSDYWKPKDGQGQEKTYWIRCKAFGSLGTRIGDLFHKGKPIAVNGKLVTEEWDDKETGKKQSKTLVLVDNFVFMGGKTDRPAQEPNEPKRDVPKAPDIDVDADDIPY